MKKNKNHGFFYLVVAALFFLHSVVYSQVKEFTGRNITESYVKRITPYKTLLNKYLKNYAIYSLDLKDISTFTKTHSAKPRFQLNLSSETFTIELEPNDMRTENFKAVAMTGSGERELIQTFTNNYKGKVNNDPLNIVRLNIDQSTFEGYIHIGKKWLYLDKLNRYIPGTSKDRIVVYDGRDVINDPTKKCGSGMLEGIKSNFQSRIQEQDIALTGNCHFLEIATEADYEYYQDFSNKADEALQRIRNILNLVEGLYTPSYNVKFILRFQQIWTVPDDPYSGDSLEVVLPQFRDWWNTNRSTISRDETHLFTGRTVLNTHIGLAYTSTICNSAKYYSSVVNYSPVTNSTIALSAHEMGHNFGAGHDPSCNGKNIMCAFIQSGTPEWSSKSLTEISNYISASGNCMTENFPSDLDYPGFGFAFGYLKLIAANHITINTSFRPLALTNTGFGYMEAGTSVILAPTNPNSLGFLAPAGSTLLVRVSDVINTCDPLAINSARSNINKGNDLLNEANSLSVSPNPFSTAFQVIINADESGVGHLVIYNSLGVKVKIKATRIFKGLNTIPFNGDDLPRGIYFVNIDFGIYKLVRKLVKL